MSTAIEKPKKIEGSESESDLNNEPAPISAPKKTPRKISDSQAEALRVGREKRLEAQKTKRQDVDSLEKKRKEAKELEAKISALEKEYLDKELGLLKHRKERLSKKHKSREPTPEQSEDEEESDESSEDEQPKKKRRPVEHSRDKHRPAFQRGMFV